MSELLMYGIAENIATKLSDLEKEWDRLDSMGGQESKQQEISDKIEKVKGIIKKNKSSKFDIIRQAIETGKSYKELTRESTDNKLTVYHGTDNKFEKFDTKLIGSRTDPGFFGKGIYFVDNKEVAKRWGKLVLTVELELKNPLVVSGISDFITKSGYISPQTTSDKALNKRNYAKAIEQVTNSLIVKGYDGVIYPIKENKGYVAFFPEKQAVIVKSDESSVMSESTTIPVVVGIIDANKGGILSTLTTKSHKDLEYFYGTKWRYNPQNQTLYWSSANWSDQTEDDQESVKQHLHNKYKFNVRRSVDMGKDKNVHNVKLSHGEILENEDYHISHTAPTKEGNAPLYDLTVLYPNDIYEPTTAAIYYGHYGQGDRRDREVISIIQSVRNKPNAPVKIYRAVPKVLTNSEKISYFEKVKAYIMKYGKIPDSIKTTVNPSKYYEMVLNSLEKLKSLPIENAPKITINRGDWIALTRDYAKEHGESQLNGEYRILTKTVRAKDVYTDAEDLQEFGYDPQ